jgi:hypothetical protein
MQDESPLPAHLLNRKAILLAHAVHAQAALQYQPQLL